MDNLELSSDEEYREESGKKSSVVSRLQQESESFLASLHMTPTPELLSSTLQTVVPERKSRQKNKVLTQKFSGITKYSHQNRNGSAKQAS